MPSLALALVAFALCSSTGTGMRTCKVDITTHYTREKGPPAKVTAHAGKELNRNQTLNKAMREGYPTIGLSPCSRALPNGSKIHTKPIQNSDIWFSQLGQQCGNPKLNCTNDDLRFP